MMSVATSTDRKQQAIIDGQAAVAVLIDDGSVQNYITDHPIEETDLEESKL